MTHRICPEEIRVLLPCWTCSQLFLLSTAVINEWILQYTNVSLIKCVVCFHLHWTNTNHVCALLQRFKVICTWLGLGVCWTVSISRLVCAKLHSYKGHVSDFETVRNDSHQDLFLAIQLTQLPIWWVLWLHLAVKQMAWSWPLTPHSSTKVNKEGTYTCTPPICLHGVDSDSKNKAAGMAHKIICTNTHFLLKMGIFSLAVTIYEDLSSELGTPFYMTDMYLQLL